MDSLSARRRDVYPKTHNTHKTESSIFPEGIEPATPGSDSPQTHAIDRAATGIDWIYSTVRKNKVQCLWVRLRQPYLTRLYGEELAMLPLT
jgi:hypothetical protein